MAQDPRQSTRSAPSPPPSPTATPPSFWQSQRENLIILVVAIVIALGIRTFIAEPRFIPSDSMVPTLLIDDRLIIEKVSYRSHPPHRGDIVVFEPPLVLQNRGYSKEQVFIKRVIGEPGDRLEVHDHKVIVNGQALDEPYIAEAPAYELPALTVPAGAIFVMGDNRNNSFDSSRWGFLPIDHIVGRAWLRFWPADRVGFLRDRRSLS